MSTCDLFNNNSGGYVDPGLTPCAGSGEDNRLEFGDKGIGIINGSEVKAFMDFSDLSIPVSSWNQQIQHLGPGEVIFIQGLSKGLTNRAQGYSVPPLTSSDDTLNPYFLQIDLSVSHYSNFAYTNSALDVSSNYYENIDIATALDREFQSQNIKVSTSYDPCTLMFNGTQPGYQFDITNVVLNIIDSSMDANSPFPPYVVDGERVQQTWVMEEDTSLATASAKYPNTATQGVILKPVYPNDANGNVLCPVDKWIYVNHAPNTVDVCEPVELTFNTDVSCDLVIAFDGSTYLGDKPIITNDVSGGPYIFDGSVPYKEVIVYDTSVDLYNADIDGSSLVNLSLFDSSVINSTFNKVNMFSGRLQDSNGVNLYANNVDASGVQVDYEFSFVNSRFHDGNILSPNVAPYTGIFLDSSIFNSTTSVNVTFINSDVDGLRYNSNIGSAYFLGDPSKYSNLKNVTDGGYGGTYYGSFIRAYHVNISDVEFSAISLTKSRAVYSYACNVERVNLIADPSDWYVWHWLGSFDSSIINSTFNGTHTRSDIIDSSVYSNYGTYCRYINCNINTAQNPADNPVYINGSIMDGCNFNTYLFPEPSILSAVDSSFFNSNVNRVSTDNTYFGDCDVSISGLNNSITHRTNIMDSELLDMVLNEGTSVYNSEINNSWSNVYVLISNPSTGDKIYVMDDPTLPLDSSSWRVDINNSLIWDSSLNNATISDSSIYRTYLQDCSLVRCTTYNCEFDKSVEYDTRTVMVDASIICDASISFDTSTYYSKTRKIVDVGMSGCSDETHMSAGDYLNWVTTNDLWKKVGDLYAWTSSPDASTTTNLINGFYVYNSHTYPVSVEYMVFV